MDTLSIVPDMFTTLSDMNVNALVPMDAQDDVVLPTPIK